MKKLLFLVIAVLFVNTVVYGKDIDAYIELLKSDVRTAKVAIITKAMEFTEEESSAFCPGITATRLCFLKNLKPNRF